MRRKKIIHLPPLLEVMGPKVIKDREKGVMIEYEREFHQVTGPMSCIIHFLPSLFFCFPCYEQYSRSIERHLSGKWLAVPLDKKQHCACCKQTIVKGGETA